MCDTLCVQTGVGRTLFAKNSDRPVREAQVAEWFPSRAAGGTLRTQYLELPDPGAYALLGSRPTWLWGLEHGVNEHGLAIGNEKVWTVDDPRGVAPALIGMDLVRLGLERATNADDALDVITSLLEQHGQAGSGEPEGDHPYYSSFLIADPHRGWILETSARTWAARPTGGGGAISNRISIGTDWTRASADVPSGSDFDRWRDPKTPTSIADARLAATTATVTRGRRADPRDLAATMRDHGDGPWGRPGDRDATSEPDLYRDGAGISVCMHVRDYQVTSASLIAELRADDASARAWVCIGSPCAGIYVPVFPPQLPAECSMPETWVRFAALRQRVESDRDALAEIRAVLAPVEAELWSRADDAAATGERGPIDDFGAKAWAPVERALARLGV